MNSICCHVTEIEAVRSTGGGCAADWAATSPNPASIDGQDLPPKPSGCMLVPFTNFTK